MLYCLACAAALACACAAALDCAAVACAHVDCYFLLNSFCVCLVISNYV